MNAAVPPWGPRPGPTRVPRVASGGLTGSEVSVWLIHPDDRPDYYETIFDFAAFVAAAHEGVPRLVVWSGRADVDRTGLRQTLRRIVTAEIDAARAQFDADGEVPSDREARQGMGLVLTLAAQGTLLAMRATPAGLAVSVLIGAAGLAAGRGRDAPDPDGPAILETQIARVQKATDAALASLDLRLHPELAAEGGDPEAWPLPQAVKDVMEIS
ncbi:hypothetical protein JSE7799_00958 [Jannaschia seosinensis]|uniref:Uncharacterized protein n=1 Tax=Jannaschia seosinensis TaxID=313367 RepID=A0A0M7B8H7_9RHOB|nr:hypothetical protein [Jannaschia seosinensis]CUH32955.1 hypothetical protein JSE7799_00958 [Jannaschia seosinensis]